MPDKKYVYIVADVYDEMIFGVYSTEAGAWARMRELVDERRDEGKLSAHEGDHAIWASVDGHEFGYWFHRYELHE